MISTVTKVIQRVWFFVLALFLMAAMFLGILFSGSWDWAISNDVYFPLYLFIIFALLGVASELDKKNVPRWPQSSVAYWSVQTAALISCYASWLLPNELLTATLLTSFFSLILWLGLVQVYRRFLKRRTRREIASALHVEETDPIAEGYSNNSDLPTAIITAVLLASQTVLLLEDWMPQLSSMTVRSAGFMLGFLTGVAYFTWCPNQSEIRDARNQARRAAQLIAESGCQEPQ